MYDRGHRSAVLIACAGAFVAIVGEPATLSAALSVSDGAFLFAVVASLVAGAVTLALRPASKTVEAPLGEQVEMEPHIMGPARQSG